MAEQKKRKSFVDWVKNIIARGKTKEAEAMTVDWLRNQLANHSTTFDFLRRKSDDKVFKDERLKKRSINSLGNETTVGRCFIYYYDAKHKETLPFWDRFPLIIMVGEAKGGFYGLNLHYLPPAHRAIFLDRLLETMTTTRVTPNSRLAITYNLLKSTQKYKYFKPAFKHYLTTQIKSNIKMVPVEEWHKFIFLHNGMWQKAGARTVWAWSKKQYS
jgi:hypothetical protein